MKQKNSQKENKLNISNAKLLQPYCEFVSLTIT